MVVMKSMVSSGHYMDMGVPAGAIVLISGEFV